MGEQTSSQAMQKKIEIPPGELAAPGDYEILRKEIPFGTDTRRVELIRQRFAGNCAEYTVLNAAKILAEVNAVINPQVYAYLTSNRRLDLDTVERDLILGLVADAQENYPNLQSTVVDVDNLHQKLQNPYAPLTNTNSALLFRTATSPKPFDFEPSDVINSNSGSDQINLALNRVLAQETLAVFVGSGAHATSWLKLSDKCYKIDPLTQGIVSLGTKEVMAEDLRRTLSTPGSFITLNDVYTR